MASRAENSKTLLMLTEVYRSKIVNQSYLRTGQADGFQGGVPCGSVVKCLTRNPGVLGSSRTGSSGVFFYGSVLGQDTSEPSLVLVKPRKDMNNVNCCRDMTEILLKAA